MKHLPNRRNNRGEAMNEFEIDPFHISFVNNCGDNPPEFFQYIFCIAL